MTALASAAYEEKLIGRREFHRSSLGLPGRLMTSRASLKVEIDDLSIKGARLRLPRPTRSQSGLLSWLGHEAYVEVIWRAELLCGVQFHPPIAEQCLLKTTEFRAQMDGNLSGKYRQLASAWVYGPGDW